MKNKSSGKTSRIIAASFNGLVSEEELEAYSKGYQLNVQAQSAGNYEDGDLLPIVYLMANMTGSILDPAIHRTLLDSGSGKTLISKSALPPGTEI